MCCRTDGDPWSVKQNHRKSEAKADNQLSPGGPNNRRKLLSQPTIMNSFRSGPSKSLMDCFVVLFGLTLYVSISNSFCNVRTFSLIEPILSIDQVSCSWIQERVPAVIQTQDPAIKES